MPCPVVRQSAYFIFILFVLCPDFGAMCRKVIFVKQNYWLDCFRMDMIIFCIFEKDMKRLGKVCLKITGFLSVIALAFCRICI